MSEASLAEPTASSRLWRALFLVTGVFLFLLLAPKPARADGLLDPVTGAVDQVTSAADQTLDSASTAVDDLSSTATSTLDSGQTVTSTVGAVTDVVDDTIQTVDGAIQSVDTTVDQLASAVEQTVDTTIGALGGVVTTAVDTATSVDQGALDQIDTQVVPVTTGSDTPAPSLPAPEQPGPVPPGPPSHPQTQQPIHMVPTQTSTSSTVERATGGSDVVPSNAQKLPAVPQGAAGAATPAGDGSPGPGGRSSSQLAAILVAALVLAGASSRWLRLYALARAPNPTIPILVSPG